jgi:hypothetical protein
MEKGTVRGRKEKVVPTGVSYGVDNLQGHIRRHGIVEKWNDGMME